MIWRINTSFNWEVERFIYFILVPFSNECIKEQHLKHTIQLIIYIIYTIKS